MPKSEFKSGIGPQTVDEFVASIEGSAQPPYEADERRGP